MISPKLKKLNFFSNLLKGKITTKRSFDTHTYLFILKVACQHGTTNSKDN